MSQDFKDQVSDQPGEALSWSEVWISALTRPAVNSTVSQHLRDWSFTRFEGRRNSHLGVWGNLTQLTAVDRMGRSHLENSTCCF